MMEALHRWFGRERSAAPSVVYVRAMQESEDLIARMREASSSRDPARALLADIWQQRHNIPFMATIHEAVTEMRSPVDGTEGRPPAKQGSVLS